jgi:membrane-associated phospholipid phosphatase
MKQAAIVLVVLAALAPEAAAQDSLGEPTPSYLVDGGAIPFLWLPALIGMAVSKWMDPRPEPLWFDADEGGLPPDDTVEVPDAAITVSALAIGVAIAGRGDESRWFHVKGLAQGLEVTTLAVKLSKNPFGRHRPDRDPDADTADSHRSFVSGHASRSAATLTYLGLYLHQHVLERPSTRALVWTGLAVLQLAVSTERVIRRRHHVTDVIAGSVLGAATATIFYLWQEQRYRRVKRRVEAPPLPAIDGPQVAWAWTF